MRRSSSIPRIALLVALSAFGSTPSRAEEESPPPARSALPGPKDLGPDWEWPWEDMGWTEGEYRSKFESDPRGMLGMLKFQMGMLSDEEFDGAMGGLAALMGGGGEQAGAPGGAAGGGNLAKLLSPEPGVKATRTQLIEALNGLIAGTLDWAQNDFSRSRPKTGRSPDADGFVPTDVDSITLTLTVYSKDLLEKLRSRVDVSGDDLKLTIAGLRKFEEEVQRSTEESAKEVEKTFDELARRGQADSEDGKRVLRWLMEVATATTKLDGHLFSGASSGYVISITKTKGKDRSVTIISQIRVGRAVLELSRLAEGPYVDNAVEHTEKLLVDMVHRLDPFGR